MFRYKIRIEYDGRGFVGWQRQDNGFSVQQALEEAVEKFCGETVTLSAPGARIPGSTPWDRWPISTSNTKTGPIRSAMR